MKKTIKVSDLPDFDMTEHLGSDADIAQYLSIVLEDGDQSLLTAALGDIAKARGMSEIAKASGLTREALYKALRPNSQPRFDTIARVCKALGLQLTTQVQPAASA
jgi:probable addiction module antidote protein